ncbi:hypothetical protein [Novosphingobium aromaticivorans]|uniref:hypothetical protein n=1 Tax=Novosphingobium aromaticivorans TaxID=48935 RepID=UPI002D21ABFD|nr:hypothetical protein [Novosphingobium aromaticivorans]
MQTASCAADQLAVRTGATHGDTAGRGADVGTIEAGANALAHVHRFGETGIGAGIADRGAKDRVLHRQPQ